MSLQRKLTAAICVCVLALGISACGGGGGGGSSGPDQATQQGTAVERAIETATNLILRLPDDADDAELKAAADAVAAARKALTDADALSAADTEAFDQTISTLEDNLARARTRIADAQRASQIRAADEARKLTAALMGTRITGISATLTHEAAPVVSGTVPGTPAVSVADLATAPAGGAATVDGWKRGRYAAADADAETEDRLVLYSNIEEPGTRPFSGEGGKYGAAEGLDADGNLPILAAATEAAPATDTTLIAATDFPTGPGIREHEAGPGGTVEVAGSFDTASGAFVCTPAPGSACTSSVKAGGGYVLSGGGGWKFVPAEGARVPEPDGEHQYFGWWLRNSGGVYSVGAFHGGEGGATDEFANLAALQGTATYSGPAAGQFAIQREGGASEAGAFEATATLAVDFGDVAAPGTVSGEVTDFIVGDAEKDWSVALGSAAIGTHGAITPSGAHTALTRWTIGDDTAAATAAWSGRFHDADPDSTPTVATGVFDAEHGTIGRMTGAFGATLQR